jgi:hypothetical protein
MLVAHIKYDSSELRYRGAAERPVQKIIRRTIVITYLSLILSLLQKQEILEEK